MNPSMPEDPTPSWRMPPLADTVAMAQLHHDAYVAYVNTGFTPPQAMQLLIAILVNAPA